TSLRIGGDPSNGRSSPKGRRAGHLAGHCGEMTDRKPLTYRDAGVDIDEGERLVELIKPAAKSTARPGAEAALGGFAAALDPKAAGFKDPIILATTDGVGTKLKIAIDTGRHETVGIDLVA